MMSAVSRKGNQPDEASQQEHDRTRTEDHLTDSRRKHSSLTAMDALTEVKLYEVELAARSPAGPRRTLPYSPQQ